MSDDMFDFKAYEPGGKTARFDVPIRGALILREPQFDDPPAENGAEPELVEGQPYLTVRYAGDSNKGYMNGVARATLKSARGHRKAPSSERILQRAKEDIQQDRELYPDYVITGWGNMPGPDRQPVSYTRAACKVFCAKLPDWIFLRLKAFASNPVNFVTDEDADTIVEEADVAETAGN